MITKDKLTELIQSALNTANLTGVLSDQDIKGIVEQRHHELEVLVSHPDWDVRNV